MRPRPFLGVRGDCGDADSRTRRSPPGTEEDQKGDSRGSATPPVGVRRLVLVSWALSLALGVAGTLPGPAHSLGQGDAGIVVGAPAAARPAAGGTAQELSPRARQVVEYLLDDWSQQFRSTSIPLAMKNVGLEPDDDLRLEVLAHFREHDDLANNLQWWGPNNYAFSDLEKRIAKYLVHIWEREGRAASVEEATEALDVAADVLQRRLGFMARAGFLQESPDRELGFALAPGYKRWAGPLQHNFHTVTIEGQKPFGVW